MSKYEYKTVKNIAECEYIEKKSRFIGHIFPVKTEADAIKIISDLRSKYWNATHNVYAYVLRNDNVSRYSDDGEPSGTAGVPVLEVLNKEELTDVLVVVTRYFGGTLLGSGGLVRAYTKSAKSAVIAGEIRCMKECTLYKIKVNYQNNGRVESEIHNENCILESKQYTQEVEFLVYVPFNNLTFRDKIIDITNGNAIIEITNERRFVDDK